MSAADRANRWRAFARRGIDLPKRLAEDALARRLGAITRVRTQQRIAALTFDDGPHPEWTPRLLDLLDQHGAKATFFVVGAMAERHREIIERIAKEGHALGNHSWSHPSFPLIGRAERISQITRCERTIGARSTKLFRPPFGDLDWSTRWLLERLGYAVICWDAAGVDWERRDADWILAMLRRQLRPGSIVLLHDQLFTFSATDEASRVEVFTALDRLLAQESAYRFVTVPELLTCGEPEKKLWLKRSDAEWLSALGSLANLGFKY